MGTYVWCIIDHGVPIGFFQSQKDAEAALQYTFGMIKRRLIHGGDDCGEDE